MPKKTVDVLVIGAGPVGLFCANELMRHGLHCRIIDKKTGLSDKSKALGIHIRTMDVMEDAGFIKAILAEGLEVDSVLFKSQGKALAEASFTGVHANRHFIIDLPQDRTEAILFEGLKAKGLDVEWQTELTTLVQDEEGVSATFTKNGELETVHAAWLIACDGAHSTVRHQLQLEFIGAEYPQNWWLADLTIDWDLPENRMQIYLHRDGPLACFPMHNKRYRLVMTAPEGNKTEPNLGDIVETFNRRSSDKALLSNPLWITKFMLHHRQIQHYRKARVFLAGDAAHIHSPMGGQGLNTGLQDIYNLIWKLALVHKKLAKEPILDSYHAERYPVGLGVLKKTDAMTKMILLKNPFLIALRNTFISLMLSFKSIKNKIATDLAGLAISYESSPIVAHFGTSKSFKAGTFLSDFKLKNTADNAIKPLHEIVQGTKHHLLLFAGCEASDIASLEAMVLFIKGRYPDIIHSHIIVGKQALHSDCGASVWLDEGQQVHRQFEIKEPCAILLRPDKYIGLVLSPVDKENFINYLATLFM